MVEDNKDVEELDPSEFPMDDLKYKATITIGQKHREGKLYIKVEMTPDVDSLMEEDADDYPECVNIGLELQDALLEILDIHGTDTDQIKEAINNAPEDATTVSGIVVPPKHKLN